MLSVTTATVHRTMCPSTPKNTTPERKGRPWSDYSGMPKRRCRSSVPKKNLSLRLIDKVEFNVGISQQSALKDEQKKPLIPQKSENLHSSKSEKSPSTRRCSNQLYRAASIQANDENTKIPESSDEKIENSSIISSSPLEIGEKRKRGFESRISVALKMLKSDDNDINYSKCRPNLETSTIDDNDETLKNQTINEEIENIFPDAGQCQTQENWDNPENWDNQVNNWDQQPVQGNWDNWDNLNATTSVHCEDPLANLMADVPYYMTGFPNPPGENRCWLNATLQTLFALPFVDQLGRLDLKKCSNLTQTLVAMQVFWREGAPEKEKTYQIVTRFKEQLEVLDESYSSQRQQDVSEFLMIFLNHVKTDCEESIKVMDLKKESENVPDNLQSIKNVQRSPQTPNKRSPLTQISPYKRRINFNDTTDRFEESSPKSVKSCDENLEYTKYDETICNPIDEFFSLPMMEHYVCVNCNKHRQRKVDNLMLYVDLPENETDSIELADAINKTLSPEDRNLMCSKCKYNEHKVYTTFRGSPNVLIVQINRYGKTSDGYVAKMNSTVHIPEALNIPTSESVSESDEGQRYVPVCTISHVGSAMDCGHYTSYVKHGDQWFHYNDMSVTPMTSTEALTAAETTAYLVFFVNVNLLKSPSLSDDTSEEVSR